MPDDIKSIYFASEIRSTGTCNVPATTPRIHSLYIVTTVESRQSNWRESPFHFGQGSYRGFSFGDLVPSPL